MKKVIVTGANGFVGSALVKELIKHNIQVVALVYGGNNTNIPNSPLVKIYDFTLEKNGELLNVLKDRDYDTFYHFAWVGSAGPNRANTELQLKNAQWCIECVRVAKELGCKKFVSAGSIMEHETIAAAFKQGNKPGLGYIYGSGKLVAHTMCMSVAAEIGIDLEWAKITNAYGPGELSPRFINTTLRKIIKNEPLQFTSGTQNYDFVYIDDVAEAFYCIGEKGKPFCHYLIGSSNAKPLRNFILEIKEAVASDKEFIFGDIPFSGVNMPLSDFDCSVTEKDTGFRAKTSFKEGIKNTLKWLKENDK